MQTVQFWKDIQSFFFKIFNTRFWSNYWFFALGHCSIAVSLQHNFLAYFPDCKRNYFLIKTSFSKNFTFIITYTLYTGIGAEWLRRLIY